MNTPPPSTSWSGRRRSFPTATRARILRRDRVCQACKQRRAVIADHVVNHAEATRLGWTQAQIDHESNGQGLCVPCHDAKTEREKAAGRRARGTLHRPREAHPGLR